MHGAIPGIYACESIGMTDAEGIRRGVHVKNNICSILVLALVSGCMDASMSEDRSDLDAVPEIPSILAEVAQTDALPCGEDTIAVITDARNNQYVFCALGNGRVGVLENTWNPEAEAPLTDRISDPVELLKTIAVNAEVPGNIIDAVRAGNGVKEPFIAGMRKVDAQQSALASACNFDTFSEAYCNVDAQGYWDQFASEFVYNHSSVYPDLGCTRGNRFCQSAGWHQRTASAYQAYLEQGSGPVWGGACAGKERVISCNGSTLFQAWRSETVGSGSWTQTLNYWVAANTAAVWIMYADGAEHCRQSADRDDLRYRADSEPDAYHNYSLFFLKSVEDSVACEPL